jgi:hypothetical protein
MIVPSLEPSNVVCRNLMHGAPRVSWLRNVIVILRQIKVIYLCSNDAKTMSSKASKVLGCVSTDVCLGVLRVRVRTISKDVLRSFTQSELESTMRFDGGITVDRSIC